jgi:replication factor C subunit 2/4
VVSALQSSLNSNSLPHLLFYGPPGTGKTSAILALSKQLFGPELYRSRVLELNASDERGINVVRDKIKKFAQIAVTKAANSTAPSFKIIILDEADSLTADAQAALRRVIEKYTKITRFCIICNYISKIIDPLASRCAKFRFKPIAFQSQLARLDYICTQEKIACTGPALEALISMSEGDLRRSITLLQSSSKLFTGLISDSDIREVAAVVPDTVIQTIYQELYNSTDSLQRMTEEIICCGYQPDGIVHQLFDYIITRQEISDAKKAKVVSTLAEADYGLVAGGSEYLQLMRAFTTMQQQLS